MLAAWWLKVFGCGAGKVKRVYRPGSENGRADALSRNPVTVVSQQEELGVQVAQVTSVAEEGSQLLELEPRERVLGESFLVEQQKDAELKVLIDYLERGTLPADSEAARKVVAQGFSFTIIEGVLYFVDAKRENRRRVAVPEHLQEGLLQENHRGVLVGQLFSTLCCQWWWPTLYKDTFARIVLSVQWWLE